MFCRQVLRPIQGFKVVVIAGLPTWCSILWTLGIMGSSSRVTMTVIVGPILLALVSYGLHILWVHRRNGYKGRKWVTWHLQAQCSCQLLQQSSDSYPGFHSYQIETVEIALCRV